MTPDTCSLAWRCATAQRAADQYGPPLPLRRHPRAAPPGLRPPGRHESERAGAGPGRPRAVGPPGPPGSLSDARRPPAPGGPRSRAWDTGPLPGDPDRGRGGAHGLSLSRLPGRQQGVYPPLAGGRAPGARARATFAVARRGLSSAARGYGAAHRAARLVVLERDAYVCQWCGAPAIEADHLGPKLPLPAVMVASCKSCNAARGARKGNRLRAALRRARPPSRAW